MLIAVTQDHINRGERVQCDKCPIALAILEMFPTAARIAVSQSSVTFKISNEIFYYKMPSAGHDFVTDFDMGRTVGACEIELELESTHVCGL